MTVLHFYTICLTIDWWSSFVMLSSMVNIITLQIHYASQHFVVTSMFVVASTFVLLH